MGPFFRDAFSLHCLIDFSTQSISGKMFWYTVGLKHYFTFSNITKKLAEKWKLKKMRGKTEITVAFQLAVCFILVARTIIKKKICAAHCTHILQTLWAIQSLYQNRMEIAVVNVFVYMLSYSPSSMLLTRRPNWDNMQNISPLFITL